MGAAASVGASRRRVWSRLRPGARLVPLGRGPAFLGLAVAGLGLLMVPVLVPVLVVLGLLAAVALPPHGVQLALVLWFGALLAACCVTPALGGIRRLARLTRRLSARWLGVPIPDPYRPAPDDRGRWSNVERLRWMVDDPATWRDLLWTIVNAAFGWTIAIIPVVLASAGVIGGVGFAIVDAPHPWLRVSLSAAGAALVVAAVWSAPLLLRAYGGLARAVLGPREDPALARRVRHLTQTRSDAIDAGAAEIRRIERDLHDGAQARLVAVGMTLNAAEELLDTDPEATRRLLVEARETSRKALTELRALVSGIHPPVLADRGLVDAFRALALDCRPRVEVTADAIGRPSPPIESAAYFAVSELLANVTKHAGAGRVVIDVRHRHGVLAIRVTDDGRGGADPGRGSGLRGIERRLAAFDGTLALSSPPGGPTVATLEIPCALS